MQLRRAVVGACAACVSTAVLYPLDTMRTRVYVHQNASAITNYFAGIRYDLTGTGIGTCVYFATYECLRSSLSVPFSTQLATVVAVLVSVVFTTPFNVWQKRSQNEGNGFVATGRLTWKVYRQSYMLSVVKNVPKNLIKYTIYEYVLACTSLLLPIHVSGAISGGISSIVVILFTTPLDVLRTRQIVGVAGRTNLFVGLKLSALISFWRNAIGHFLIELCASRP